MRHFATQSGKSKGQFYTPAEVSRIMAQVIGIGPDTRRDQTVHDPTCGSGSLLIKANDEYRRFEYGEPPAKNGDYAYLLHLLASLKSTGKGAIIMPHGVLFRGNREAGIRRRLVRHGVIKGVIGLPANLFFGTGIPACIVVIDKENAVGRQGIFMIDASKSFRKDGAKNRLRERDIHRIVDVFNEQRETPGYARMVPLAEIASETNDFNLNIPRYVDSSEAEDLHDLGAHLRGGIPDRDIEALGAYWEVFPGLRDRLFSANGRGGYSDARIDADEVRKVVLQHGEFGQGQGDRGATGSDREPEEVQDGSAASRACRRPVFCDGAGRG